MLFNDVLLPNLRPSDIFAQYIFQSLLFSSLLHLTSCEDLGRFSSGSPSLPLFSWLVPRTRLAPFIAIETAAVVAEGDRIPRGEVSGESELTDVTGRGVGSLDTVGLVTGSCGTVGETLVGVGAGVRMPPAKKERKKFFTKYKLYICKEKLSAHMKGINKWHILWLISHSIPEFHLNIWTAKTLQRKIYRLIKLT